LPRPGNRRVLRGPFTCKHCGIEYATRRPVGEGESYCSRQCYVTAQKQARGLGSQTEALAKRRTVISEIAALRAIKAAWDGTGVLYADCTACSSRFRSRRGASKCVKCQTARRPRCCLRCSSDYEALDKHQRFCSDECRNASLRERKRKVRLTDGFKRRKRADRIRCKAKRRARQADGAQRVDPLAVFRRDDWTCHICKLRAPESLRGTCDPRAPELDHLISLAEGGSHTWANVACACRKCNGLKGSRSFGQLNLGWAC
jgi:5-methylcytosine-specific restriction endonuclease McrA